MNQAKCRKNSTIFCDCRPAGFSNSAVILPAGISALDLSDETGHTGRQDSALGGVTVKSE